MRKLSLFVFLVIFTVFFSQKTWADLTPKQNKINYDLAYPGLLPDNPFYKLKVIKTKLLEILITNPKQKIEFYLLETDKGILASAILVDKHEIKLARDTALKAENNYTLLTGKLNELDDKKDVKLFTRLETAALKHQEVLQSLAGRVQGEDKKSFETVLDFSKRNLQKIKEFENSTKSE